LVVQGGFTFVFQAHMYYDLIRVTPLLLTLYHHAPLLFKAYSAWCILSSCTDVMFQYFSL
jgi:hypothetical protein